MTSPLVPCVFRGCVATHLAVDTAHTPRPCNASNLKSVILGHLSNDCNTPEVARAEVILALSNRGISHVEVNCANRNELTGPFIIECESPQDINSNSDHLAQAEFPLFS